MQIMLIILVAIVLLPQPSADVQVGAGWWVAGATWLAALVLVVVNAVCARLLLKRMEAVGSPASITTADRLLRMTQWLGVALVVVAVLGFGLVEVIRSGIGDLLVLDELLAVLPAFAVFIAAWWMFYPFEARVREARIIRELDEGLPISPPPRRGAWVRLQVRTHLLLLLIPIFLVATAADIGGRLAILAVPDSPPWVERIAAVAMALPVIWLAPSLVVRLLDTVPLPPGEVRVALEGACRKAGVRIRDLLLWRTGGALYNGAVTGFLPGMRWVLLTDGLLQRLER
ncbi:MAG: hypothetical protein MK085_08900, partial [Phycisphaerales bacterium]|nr:hypothetical protein [Phycisphaerales bacterium]